MSEWIETSLSRLVTFQKGRKVETSPFLMEGYSDYLGASGIEGRSDGFASTRFAVLAKPTDILMLWDGERSGLVGFGKQGVVASTVSRLSPNERIDPKYLYFTLFSKFEWIQHRRTGTGVPHVPKDIGRILNLRFPKEKPVQQKIAAILSGVDAAIEKTEALTAKYQQIKAGLMHDLFTRGVLPNGQLRPPREKAPEMYQETVIGWVPREWDIEKLGTMAKIVSGVTLGSRESPSNSIEVPYLRVANVQDGYLDLSEIKTVRIFRRELEFLRLQPGDVLMNEGGDFDKLGRGAVWAGEIDDCVHQNHVFRARTDPDILLPRYLAFYSESTFGKKYFLLSSKQSTNLASINSTQLNAYPIAFPSLTEQQEIVTRIAAANQRINRLKTEASKLHQQKLGLMQDLLTGKVPVKVSAVETANG